MLLLSCLLLSLLLLASCSTSVPQSYTETGTLPAIYPDYVDVTVPVNIAPLTFEYDGDAEQMIARYSHGSTEIVCADKMQPSLSDWRTLTAQAQGDAIQVDVYTRSGDQWQHHKPFSIYVSPDSIDPYLSYRLIPPS